MFQVTQDRIKRRRTRPADFGLPEGDRTHLVASSVAESADVIRTALAGKGGEHNAPPGPETSRYNMVAINAATALLAAGKSQSFNDAANIGKRQHRLRCRRPKANPTSNHEQQAGLNRQLRVRT